MKTHLSACKLTSAGLLEHMEARLGEVFLSIDHCRFRFSGFTVVFFSHISIVKRTNSVNFLHFDNLLLLLLF